MTNNRRLTTKGIAFFGALTVFLLFLIRSKAPTFLFMERMMPLAS